jgi:hypothetical protein
MRDTMEPSKKRKKYACKVQRNNEKTSKATDPIDEQSTQKPCHPLNHTAGIKLDYKVEQKVRATNMHKHG